MEDIKKSKYGNTKVKTEISRDELNISIPKLQIKIVTDIPYPGTDYGQDIFTPFFEKDSSIDNYVYYDRILVKWDQFNVNFLDKNPEIWLFRLTKSKNEEHVKVTSWKHPVHLDGSKYPNSDVYSGTSIDGTLDKNILLRNTEFDITERSKYQEIEINPNDWFTGEYGVRYDSSLPFDNVDYIKNTSGNIKKNYTVFKLAIVIDSDEINNSKINPLLRKIYGPLSEEFHINKPQIDTTYFYNNIAYFTYNIKSMMRFYEKPKSQLGYTFYTNQETVNIYFQSDGSNLDIQIICSDGYTEIFNSSTSYNFEHTFTGNAPYYVNIIDNVDNLYILNLNDNRIVDFNPTIPLPSNLYILNLNDNRIVDFNPTLPLPTDLHILYLNNNQIVDFNPTIPIPSNLYELRLDNNDIIDFNPTLPLPTNLYYLDLYYNLFTNESFENLLNYLDVSTFDVGTKYLNVHQTPQLVYTSQALIYKASLETKGWNIYI